MNNSVKIAKASILLTFALALLVPATTALAAATPQAFDPSEPATHGSLPTSAQNLDDDDDGDVTQITPKTYNPKGTITDSAPTFVWENITNNTGAHIVVKNGNIVVQDLNLTSSDYTCVDNQCSYDSATDLPIAKLSWNVTVMVGGLSTRPSKYVRFEVSIVPTAVSPKSTINTNTPTYVWSEIALAEKYNLLVKRGAVTVLNIEVLPADLTCVDGKCSYTDGTALSNASYTWSARTFAGGIWSKYSKVVAFKVSYTGPTATPTTAPTATPSPTPEPIAAHVNMTEFNGAETCAQCHATEAQGVLNSEHIQWTGKWNDVNTYCTAPEPSKWGCLGCHAGTGKVVNPTIADVDCLICHNNTYKRKLYSTGEQLTLTSWNGDSHTYTIPAADADGNYQFVPNYAAMPAGTTMLSLAQSVTKPNSQTCLNCHAKAGGSDGAKRGDIYNNLASPTLSTHDDFHMSPSGANLQCTDCHQTGHDHKIPGQGIDLRVNEGTVTCEQCHSAKPHSNTQLNTHAARVACQTCHIPTFGKNTSTEMSRDWTNPVWSPSGLGGQGAWLGEEVRGSNVIPTYVWWNNTSWQYTLGETINAGPDGTYALSKAYGNIDNGKIYPVKIHTAVQPRENSTGSLVAYDVLWNFMTGLYEEAAQNGVDFMGLPGGYTWVNTKVEQLITHGVEPKSSAVSCTQCHGTTSRINLPAMGYTLKASQATVCTQCHGSESMPSFTKVHDIHVKDKKVDCSLCHSFTRPERNLNTNLQFED